MAQRSQQRSRVPQFGKWNTSEDIAYTVCFEKAREQRGGGGTKVGNPNDPQENPELHLNGAPKSKFAPPEAYKPRVAAEEPRGRSSNPSAHKDSAASRANDSRNRQFQSHGAAYGEPRKRHARADNGYEHGADRSPLHHQAKASGGAAYGSGSPGAYGRSRMRADDTPGGGGGAAVPRFGEWNVNDRASGDGYTTVFNRIKEEKQRRPMAATSPGQNVRHASPYTGDRKPSPREKPKGCCFPWM